MTMNSSSGARRSLGLVLALAITHAWPPVASAAESPAPTPHFDAIECISSAIGASLDKKTPTAATAGASDCEVVIDAIERDSFDVVRLRVLEKLLGV